MAINASEVVTSGHLEMLQMPGWLHPYRWWLGHPCWGSGLSVLGGWHVNRGQSVQVEELALCMGISVGAGGEDPPSAPKLWCGRACVLTCICVGGELQGCFTQGGFALRMRPLT